MAEPTSSGVAGAVAFKAAGGTVLAIVVVMLMTPLGASPILNTRSQT